MHPLYTIRLVEDDELLNLTGLFVDGVIGRDGKAVVGIIKDDLELNREMEVVFLDEKGNILSKIQGVEVIDASEDGVLMVSDALIAAYDFSGKIKWERKIREVPEEGKVGENVVALKLGGKLKIMEPTQEREVEGITSYDVSGRYVVLVDEKGNVSLFKGTIPLWSIEVKIDKPRVAVSRSGVVAVADKKRLLKIANGRILWEKKVGDVQEFFLDGENILAVLPDGLHFYGEREWVVEKDILTAWRIDRGVYGIVGGNPDTFMLVSDRGKVRNVMRVGTMWKFLRTLSPKLIGVVTDCGMLYLWEVKGC